MYDRHDLTGRPAYFVLVDWRNDRVVTVRDFRFARYAIDGVELLVLG